jgi:hypothetical protein
LERLVCLWKTELGGPNAEHEVESVLPGALVSALLEDHGPSGRLYAAQDYRNGDRLLFHSMEK